jgi:hypothetical protein
MESPKITQLPFPGSSGITPTGALQFQDDWPGLFIRGDDAIDLMVKIRSLSERLGDYQDVVVCGALLRLNKIADIIEREVIVRSGPQV